MALAFAALVTPASAQLPPENTFTDTFFQALVFNPATVTNTQVNAFSTQVLGRLNGGTVFNQTYAAAVNDAAVQEGFNSARLAITTSGGPGVVIGTPQRLSSTTTSATTSSTLYSLAGISAGTPNTVVTFGPAPITIGQRSSCNVAGLPSTTKPTCTNLPGTPYNVGDDETNFNTVTTTNYTINTATTNTTTTTTSEVWAIDGTVRQMGTAHAAVQAVAFDIGDIFLARMLAPGQANLGVPLMDGGKPTRWTAFLEGFGLTGRLGGSTKVAGSDYTFAGGRGGLTYAVSPDLAVGVAAQGGRTTWGMGDAFSRESAGGDDVRAGMFALYAPGQWRFAAAGFAGRAHVDTAVLALGFAPSTGAYDATVYGAGAMAGYAFVLGNLTITPHAGVSWYGWHSPSYTETGGLIPLAVNSATREQVRPSLGLAVDRVFALDNGAILTVGASGRAFAILGDTDGFVTATFANMPGTTFGVEAPGQGRSAFEIGGYSALAFNRTLSITASFTSRLLTHGSSHTGQAGLKVSF